MSFPQYLKEYHKKTEDQLKYIQQLSERLEQIEVIARNVKNQRKRNEDLSMDEVKKQSGPKIILLSTGSRGDVQPLIALGKSLQNEGYDVTLGAPPNNRTLVESNHLSFEPIGVDTKEFMKAFKLGKSDMQEKTREMYSKSNKDAFNLCQKLKPNMIMFHSGVGIGPSISEALQIPAIEFCFIPWHPTCSWQNLLVPSIENPTPSKNYLSHLQVMEASWSMSRECAEEYRQQMNLSPKNLPYFGYWHVKRRVNKIPLLIACSYSLFQSNDWTEEDNVHIVGNWFLDDSINFTPSKELEEFLSNGPEPLYIGFGSMFSSNDQKLAKTILRALNESKERAIICGGWSDFISELKDEKNTNILVVEDVPHNWLFSKVKGIISHGGVGTFSAALRSGKPQFIVPFIVDQPFWGNKVHELGVGPNPVPVEELTAQNLISAIKKMNDEDIKNNASSFGKKIEVESGIPNAISIIRKQLSSGFQAGNPIDKSIEAFWKKKNEKITPDAFWNFIDRMEKENQIPKAVALIKYALDNGVVPTRNHGNKLVQFLLKLDPNSSNKYKELDISGNGLMTKMAIEKLQDLVAYALEKH